MTTRQLTRSTLAQALTSSTRARTDEQKRARRAAILAAAELHLAEVGFESFSMAEVGKRARVAKGTLYLYFETREELLLALYCQTLERWEGSISGMTCEGMHDSEFAAAFYAAAHADPLFLPLTSRLDSVIEHNVSLQSLVSAKRFMASLLRRVAETLAPRLELSAEQSFDALSALSSLQLGVAQIEAGPAVKELNVPDDVRQFAEAFAPEDIFTRNACRILTGIRHGQ